MFSLKNHERRRGYVRESGNQNKRAMVEGYRVGVKPVRHVKLKNGHYVNKYVAFTAGIAPISDPRYALVILINDPKAGQYYGGAVSAPVFKHYGLCITCEWYCARCRTNRKTARRTVRLSDQKLEKMN